MVFDVGLNVLRLEVGVLAEDDLFAVVDFLLTVHGSFVEAVFGDDAVGFVGRHPGYEERLGRADDDFDVRRWTWDWNKARDDSYCLPCFRAMFAYHPPLFDRKLCV